jgi:ABC-type glycerol-3-phosphate transport system substrate-binding protein
MRKALPILLVLLLASFGAVPVFAGGAQEKGAAAETITVLMGIDAAGKHMGERAVEFEAQTGIKVNLVEVEWDTMVNKQSVALTAGEPTYDIVDCGSFMLPEYVPGGLYEDISDLFPPEVKEKYMPGMIDSVTVGGKVYAAPLMASWTIMFYNGAMFEEVGLDPSKPPVTWNELMAYGKKLQSEDTYAYTDSLGPGEYVTTAFFRWARSAGANISEWQGDTVKWKLDSPAAVDAARFLQRMIREGTMDPGAPTYYQQQIADLFGKGHAAMFVNWDMMQLAFKDPEQTPYAGKIRTAPMPGKTAALVGGSIEGHEYMAVPSASLHKESAKKFIQFISSMENEKRRAVEQGMTPVYKALFDDPDVQKVLDLDTIFKSAANCYYRPAIPEYTQCSDIISTEIQNILVNNKDVNKALMEANAKSNALVGM